MVKVLDSGLMVNVLDSGLMVNVLDSGLMVNVLEPWAGHCVVFLGKTASLHPGV